MTEFARIYLNVEPTTELVPIQPTAHYAMGGIPTDVDTLVVTGEDSTPIPGLFAAGECACVSVHGANRLGTNSLLDIVVFGRRGGKAMTRFCKDADLPELPERPEGFTDLLNASCPVIRARTPPTSARSSRRRCSTWRSSCGPRRA